MVLKNNSGLSRRLYASIFLPIHLPPHYNIPLRTPCPLRPLAIIMKWSFVSRASRMIIHHYRNVIFREPSQSGNFRCWMSSIIDNNWSSFLEREHYQRSLREMCLCEFVIPEHWRRIGCFIYLSVYRFLIGNFWTGNALGSINDANCTFRSI